MKKFLFVLLVMGLVFSSGPVLAKDGFYIGGDLGIAVAPEIGMEAWDSDVPTACDPHWNSDENGDYLLDPLRDLHQDKRQKNCNQSTRDSFNWVQQFDGGTGILAGAALGYRMGSFRVEAEYFYRGTTYDDLDDSFDTRPAGTTIQGGKEDELDHHRRRRR